MGRNRDRNGFRGFLGKDTRLPIIKVRKIGKFTIYFDDEWSIKVQNGINCIQFDIWDEIYGVDRYERFKMFRDRLLLIDNLSYPVLYRIARLCQMRSRGSFAPNDGRPVEEITMREVVNG